MEPVCFPHIVDLFPDFTLGTVKELVHGLQIAADDYDYFLTWILSLNHWETHTLTTPWRVTEQQQLIYKLVRKMTVMFMDSKCPGLIEELNQQHHVAHSFV